MAQNILLLEQAPFLDTSTFDLSQLLSSPRLFNRVSINDTLDNAVANTESSHEPVLVFNDDHFQGLISLNSVLYQNKFPHATKVKRAMIIPPRLTIDSDFFEIIRAMISIKVYALPVFDSRSTLVGMIELAKLFHWLDASNANVASVAQMIDIRKPITILKSAKVSEALDLFRTKKISRLIVVEENGNLEGMLTRNHLREVYITPSSRQRFNKTEDPLKTRAFDPAQEIKREDVSLMQLYQRNTFTGQSFWQTDEIIRRLIESNYNSVVIVDQDHKPAGFLSNRDVLQAINKLNPGG